MQAGDEVVELSRNAPGDVCLAAALSQPRSRLWHFAERVFPRERSERSSGSIPAAARWGLLTAAGGVAGSCPSAGSVAPSSCSD